MMKSILSLPDLDEEDRVEAVLSVTRDVTFTRAEMDAAIAQAVEDAKAEAHAEGFKAGEAAMLQSAEAKRAEFLEALAPKLEDLFNEHSEYCAALEQEMTLFMRDFCEKLFPDLVSILGRDRVAAELSDISRRALGSQWLEVRVPTGYGFLAQEFARPKDAKIELKVIEDPKLRPVAVEANWENGRSEYNFDNLCGDILLLLKNPKPDPKSSGKRL